MSDTVQHTGAPHPELIGMVARLAGDYCPSLLSTDVVAVARSAFSGRGDSTLDEVEATAREVLDLAAEDAGRSTASTDVG